jgi:hypothetical protein
VLLVGLEDPVAQDTDIMLASDLVDVGRLRYRLGTVDIY